MSNSAVFSRKIKKIVLNSAVEQTSIKGMCINVLYCTIVYKYVCVLYTGHAKKYQYIQCTRKKHNNTTKLDSFGSSQFSMETDWHLSVIYWTEHELLTFSCVLWRSVRTRLNKCQTVLLSTESVVIILCLYSMIFIRKKKYFNTFVNEQSSFDWVSVCMKVKIYKQQ